jgi:hypothetical protein
LDIRAYDLVKNSLLPEHAALYDTQADRHAPCVDAIIYIMGWLKAKIFLGNI